MSGTVGGRVVSPISKPPRIALGSPRPKKKAFGQDAWIAAAAGSPSGLSKDDSNMSFIQVASMHVAAAGGEAAVAAAHPRSQSPKRSHVPVPSLPNTFMPVTSYEIVDRRGQRVAAPAFQGPSPSKTLTAAEAHAALTGGRGRGGGRGGGEGRGRAGRGRGRGREEAAGKGGQATGRGRGSSGPIASSPAPRRRTAGVDALKTPGGPPILPNMDEELDERVTPPPASEPKDAEAAEELERKAEEDRAQEQSSRVEGGLATQDGGYDETLYEYDYEDDNGPSQPPVHTVDLEDIEDAAKADTAPRSALSRRKRTEKGVGEGREEEEGEEEVVYYEYEEEEGEEGEPSSNESSTSQTSLDELRAKLAEAQDDYHNLKASVEEGLRTLEAERAAGVERVLAAEAQVAALTQALSEARAHAEVVEREKSMEAQRVAELEAANKELMAKVAAKERAYLLSSVVQKAEVRVEIKRAVDDMLAKEEQKQQRLRFALDMAVERGEREAKRAVDLNTKLSSVAADLKACQLALNAAHATSSASNVAVLTSALKEAESRASARATTLATVQEALQQRDVECSRLAAATKAAEAQLERERAVYKRSIASLNSVLEDERNHHAWLYHALTTKHEGEEASDDNSSAGSIENDNSAHAAAAGAPSSVSVTTPKTGGGGGGEGVGLGEAAVTLDKRSIVAGSTREAGYVNTEAATVSPRRRATSRRTQRKGSRQDSSPCVGGSSSSGAGGGGGGGGSGGAAGPGGRSGGESRERGEVSSPGLSGSFSSNTDAFTGAGYRECVVDKQPFMRVAPRSALILSPHGAGAAPPPSDKLIKSLSVGYNTATQWS